MESLSNYKKYFCYANSIKNREKIFINVPTDITVQNINDHIEAIYAILKDGIETDYIHNLMINISWGSGIECDLYVIDYWYSLFMWKMILINGEEIRPKHIFWGEELKRKDIKSFVDKFILTRDNKIKLGNKFLNNNICDGLWAFSNIETFAYYLANTINNEDDIMLMNLCPEFNQLYHTSLENVPFENIKSEGQRITDRAIDIIKDSKKYLGFEHGLAASFKASEAINPRQFKESRFNIGTKPNGSGGIYPYAINKSFTNGGVNDKLSYFIESSSARTAQILSKINVGSSGDFARILGLNNTDTVLNKFPEYQCNSKNFIMYEIKSDKHLSMIKNRYYRFNPNGMEYIIDPNDKSLIGKTVYLRSPITCASLAAGKGICRRCYGDLYYTNININIGKIAAEILSSQLTQILLSAKHLLETKIKAMKWNAEFEDYFNVNINNIILSEELEDEDLRKHYLIIDPDNIYLENEEEDTVTTIEDDGNEDDDNIIIDDDAINTYSEYITSFKIKFPSGNIIEFKTEDNDPIYISRELNAIIRKKATPDDGMVNISLESVKNIILFYIKINNNEISKTMDDIMNIIKKNDVIQNLTKDSAQQAIVDLVINGGLTIDAVHLEVILANQIVSENSLLEKPRWDIPNIGYKLVSLNTALTYNPSVIISLLYQNLHRTLYNPLTYRKSKPSFFDLFFHEQPQNYINPDLLNHDDKYKLPESGVQMVKLVDKNKKK